MQARLYENTIINCLISSESLLWVSFASTFLSLFALFLSVWNTLNYCKQRGMREISRKASGGIWHICVKAGQQGSYSYQATFLSPDPMVVPSSWNECASAKVFLKLLSPLSPTDSGNRIWFDVQNKEQYLASISTLLFCLQEENIIESWDKIVTHRVKVL